MFLKQSRLNSINFNEDEILKIIRALNIRKAHGHDGLSIRMIKICDKSLLKPLILLFENSTKSYRYPDIWKRSNIIPLHKKMIKNQLITTDQYLFGPFLEKYLKKLFSIKFILFVGGKTTKSKSIWISSVWLVYKSITCYYTYLKLLIVIHLSKLGQFS